MVWVRKPWTVGAWPSRDFHVRNDDVHTGMFRQFHILAEANFPVLDGTLEGHERHSVLQQCSGPPPRYSELQCNELTVAPAAGEIRLCTAQ